MTVLIDDRTDEGVLEEYLKTINKAAAASLRFEEFDEACEISVSIVTDEEIRNINHEFRGIDRATDVLSFPQLDFSENEVAGVNENDELILGDIIISLDKAISQAAEYGHSLQREIAFLTVHSMLHLLGYDHCAAGEELEMINKQKAIMELLGIGRD